MNLAAAAAGGSSFDGWAGGGCAGTGGCTVTMNAPTGVTATFNPLVYSISGTVTSGGALPGVTMTLSGAGSGTTTTDGNGYYIFSNLADGGYTVTPSMAGYMMSPLNRAVTLSGADLTWQDFTATILPSPDIMANDFMMGAVGSN